MGISYRSPWWCRPGHINTIYSYLIQSAPRVQLRRERLDTPDSDFVDLDWLDGPEGSPLVFLHHGLEGSSDSPYIRRLMAAIQERGWSGVSLNARGCSGEDNKQKISYHAAFIEDIRFVLQRLTTEHPQRPIVMVGYSLGGSQIANYLGREGTGVPSAIKGAFLCSPPMTLLVGAEALKKGFNQVYSAKFLRTMCKKAKRKGTVYPEIAENAKRAGRARSIEEFDDVWTAPNHGFENVRDYYEKAAAGPWLKEIVVPTRILHARDDSLVPAEGYLDEHFAHASQVDLCWTEYGGHVGFVSADEKGWLENRICEWLAHRLEAHESQGDASR